MSYTHLLELSPSQTYFHDSKGVLATEVLLYLFLSTALLYLSQKRSHEDWLVGWFGFNGPLRQYFGLYRAVSQREGEGGEKG